MTFKHVVTGDTLYTDVKGADGFEFVPTATMVFSMNAVPRLGDATGGILRRLYFIPFRAKFVDGEQGCDPDMPRKMSQPDAIMQLVTLGLMGLMTVVRLHRMTPNESMAQEVAEVAADNNSVLQWIDDEGIDKRRVVNHSIDGLFREYVRWAENSGIAKPFQKRTFSKAVSTHFVVDRKNPYREDANGNKTTSRCFVLS